MLMYLSVLRLFPGAVHPPTRPRKCRGGKECPNANCRFLHPKVRTQTP